ncbi:MAG: SGNH/GDSL hydrolase family protein [bacterium]|nr:SGNH/GDSL hydrolase family protein [bacterium]
MAYYDDREIDAFEGLGSGPVIHDPRTRIKTKNIVRLSRNPEIVYELIPGVRGLYKGAVITINEDGFRGPVVREELPANSVRIVGIGDSVMFGYGVGDRDYYLSFLREDLAQSRPDRAWEVINAGVPGYNTTMEVATLEEKLLKYTPDLVLIEYVPNDLDLPRFIRNRSPYFALDHSYIGKYVQAIRKGWGHAPDDRLASLPRDSSEIPEEYVHMLGIDGYRNAMSKLARLRAEHGFDVVVLCSLRLPPAVRAIVTELGFPTIEAYDAMEAYLVARGSSMDAHLKSELVVSNSDPHPSPLGHRIITSVILEGLEAQGLFGD